MIDTVIRLRPYILLASQLSGAVLCLYFIIKCQNYEVSWYWTWLPDWFTSSVNSFLGWTGTLVLIIPLSIIISAILIPENVALKMASSFLGISCSLAVIMSGFFTNSLLEVYNMRVFLITKLLSLDEKTDIFITEFKHLTASLSNLRLQNFLEYHISPDNIEHYQDNLTLLKERLAIKVYASETVTNLTTMFNQHSQIEKISHIATYTKYGLYLIGGLVVGLAILALIRYFTTGADLLEGAKLMKGNATASLLGSDEATLSAEHMEKLSKIVKTMLEHFMTEAKLLDLLAKNPEIKALFERTEVLEALLLALSKHVNYHPKA